MKKLVVPTAYYTLLFSLVVCNIGCSRTEYPHDWETTEKQTARNIVRLVRMKTPTNNDVVAGFLATQQDEKKLNEWTLPGQAGHYYNDHRNVLTIICDLSASEKIWLTKTYQRRVYNNQWQYRSISELHVHSLDDIPE